MLQLSFSRLVMASLQVSVAEAEVEDVNQKFVDQANQEEEPLMSDRMRPPPPFDYTML